MTCAFCSASTLLRIEQTPCCSQCLTIIQRLRRLPAPLTIWQGQIQEDTIKQFFTDKTPKNADGRKNIS